MNRTLTTLTLALTLPACYMGHTTGPGGRCDDTGCLEDDTITCYDDADGDGHGNGNYPEEYIEESCPEGTAADGRDACDDDPDAWTYGACYPEADADTDADSDSDTDSDADSDADIPQDNDGDGYDTGAADCDDTRADVYPGAPENCDGRDNDCDGTVDEGCPTDTTGTVTFTWYTDTWWTDTYDADEDGRTDDTTDVADTIVGLWETSEIRDEYYGWDGNVSTGYSDFISLNFQVEEGDYFRMSVTATGNRVVYNDCMSTSSSESGDRFFGAYTATFREPSGSTCALTLWVNHKVDGTVDGCESEGWASCD